MPKVKRPIRTVVRTEIPAKYEKQLAHLHGLIEKKRQELGQYRHLDSVRAAIEAAKTELKLVLEDRERAEKDIEVARSRMSAERRELKDRAWTLKQAEISHEQLARDHRAGVAADRAQLDLRRREIAAEEDRLIQAREAATQEAEGARAAGEQAKELLSGWQAESRRARELYDRATQRIVAAAYVESMIRQQRNELRMHMVLCQTFLRKFRLRRKQLGVARREHVERQKALDAFQRKLDEMREGVIAAEESVLRDRKAIQALQAQVEQRQREQDVVEHDQAKREARLLGLKTQLTDKERRLSRISSDLGKRIMRDAETPSE